MEKSNKKAPIVFYIGTVLLCVWLTSVCLIGGLYAKYSTYASSSDSARVALFDIQPGGELPKATLVMGKLDGDKRAQTYSFAIVNNSEVSVSCDIYLTGYMADKDADGQDVEYEAPFQKGVQVTLSGPGVNRTITTDDGNIVFQDVTIPYRSESEFTVTFALLDENKYIYQVIDIIRISVSAEQLD